MIVIEYAENGSPVSDFNYKDWIYNVKSQAKKDVDHVFTVSTSLPIQMVQLAIVNGELDHNKITFRFWDTLFQANEYGAILDRPRGFADVGLGASEDMLRMAIKKRRSETNWEENGL